MLNTSKIITAYCLNDIKNNNNASYIIISNVLVSNLGCQLIVALVKQYSNIKFIINCHSNLHYLLFFLQNNLTWFLFSNNLQYKGVIQNIIMQNHNIKIFTSNNMLLEFLQGM